MLRTNQLAGTDQVFLERVDNGAIVSRLTVNQELAAGDVCPPAREGLDHRGSGVTTARPGRGSASSRTRRTSRCRASPASACAGTTGRLDDFGARSLTPGTHRQPPTGSRAAGGALEREPLLDGAGLRRWLADHELQGVPRHERRSRELPADAGIEHDIRGLGADERHDLLLQGVGRELERRGALSNEAAATPPTSSHPSCRCRLVDNFDRLNENPLSDGGRWSNGDHRLGRDRSLTSPRNCARLLEVDDVYGVAQHAPSTAPTPRSWARISTLPGTGNCAASVRAHPTARARPPTTATCCERSSRQAPTRSCSSVIDNGTIVTRLLTLNQELAAGDTLLLRAKGTTSRPGVTTARAGHARAVVTDSTYGAAGFAGIGLRGTTGRLEDFGVANARRRPRHRPECSAVPAGDRRQRPGLPRLDCSLLERRLGHHRLPRIPRNRPQPDRRPHPRSRPGHELPRQRAHERADLLLQGHRPERDRRERGLERGECDAEPPPPPPRVLLSPCRRQPATPRSPELDGALLERRLGHHRLPRIPRNRPQPDRRPHPRSRPGHELPRQRAHERADLLLQGHRPERDRRERGLERGECDAEPPPPAPRVLRSPCRRPRATPRSP